MKVPIQSKIAELESRIAALEAERGQRTTISHKWTPEAEKEWRGIWKHVDAFFDKVFYK